MKIFFLILTTFSSIYSIDNWIQLLTNHEYNANTINAFMLNNNQIIAQTEEIFFPQIVDNTLTFKLQNNLTCTIKLQKNFLNNNETQYYTIDKLEEQKDHNNKTVKNLTQIKNVAIQFYKITEPNWYQKIINYIKKNVNGPKTVVVVIVLSTLILVVSLTLTDDQMSKHQKATTICTATGTAACTITNLFV